MQHELKTWPGYFQAVWDKKKTFELRKNDRGFQEGDILILREFELMGMKYSGRAIKVSIKYILEGIPGLESGYCILALSKIKRLTKLN